jgi:hypothetical protein
VPRPILPFVALLAALATPAIPLAQAIPEPRDPDDALPPDESRAYAPPCFAPPCPAPPEEPAEAPPERAGEAPSSAAPAAPPASEEPGKLPPPPPAPSQPPAGPPSPFAPEDTWLDASHAFLEEKLFAPVIRFDRFFSDERELEAERSRSFIRVRTQLRFREDGAPAFGASIRADLRLPGLGKQLQRLRLVIAGESEDTSNTLFPNDPTATPLQPGRVGRANAELRYGLWDGLLAHLDLGAGVLGRLPPGVFGRLRYRLSIPVSTWFLTRYVATGFWRTDTGFGTSGAMELERPLGPASLARIGGIVELSERSQGGEWASEVALLRTIGPRRAISVGAGMEGATRAPVAVGKYRIFTRVRREVWRRWIFAELEPEMAWPWDQDEGRHREFIVTVRLEVQFQGSERSDRPLGAAAEPAGPPRLPAMPSASR